MTERLPEHKSYNVVEANTEEGESFVVSILEDDIIPEQLSSFGLLSEDPVKDYLRQIGKTPLLTAEQEVELSKSIEAGLFAKKILAEDVEQQKLSPTERDELEWLAVEGSQAKNHMLEANLRLVVSLAKRYTGRNMSFLDLIQEGNTGLIRAVEKFDYQKGYKFSTYATWWIRQSITRGMGDQSKIIRIPVHMTEQMNKLNAIERHIMTKLGREPTIEELAKEMQVSTDKVLEIKKYLKQEPMSLNTLLGQDESTELGDLIPDSVGNEDDRVNYAIVRKQIIGYLKDHLTQREFEVIMMRFGFDGEPKTLDAIGEMYGVTRERIRQIEMNVRLRLKNHPSFATILRDVRETAIDF